MVDTLSPRIGCELTFGDTTNTHMDTCFARVLSYRKKEKKQLEAVNKKRALNQDKD